MTKLNQNKLIVLITAFVCFTFGQLPASAQTLKVVQSTNHTESLPLTSIDRSAALPNGLVRTPNLPLPLQSNSGGTGSGTNGAPQTSSGTPMNVVVGTDFDGMLVPDGGYTPSDNNLAIGPNHVVQTVNGLYTIYSKSGTPLLGPNPLTPLWDGLGGPCAANNGGTPAVQYDVTADRWIITQMASLSDLHAECIAVSKTSDPTGAYYLYSFSFESNLNDHPKFGVWPTATNSAYLAAYNLFSNGSSFSGAEICAYDRAGMLAGAANPIGLCFTGINGASYLPSDLEGATPPLDGTPAYFADLYSTDGSLGMYQMHFDFASATAALTPFSNVQVDSFSPASPVPQPGTNVPLDSLSDRLTYRLGFRMYGDHESMVVTHSVSVEGTAGLRWYELRAPVSPTGNFTLFQQGTLAPGDGIHRWMGSAAMDSAGDIALGYSASGSILYPSLRYTGRTPADPAGATDLESSSINGIGAPATYTRWTDYSSVRLDPGNDCMFWFVSQNSSSSTRIGTFKFSECGQTQMPQVSLSLAGGVTGDSTVKAASNVKSNSTPQSAAIAGPTNVGVFRSGFYWLEDVDGNQQFNQPPDQAFAFGGIAGDIPITGDWNGDGRTKVGIYRPSNGLFILDSNGDEQFDAGDAVYNLGVGTQAGDLPVVGDWNGDGRTKVGLFRQGFFWILDYNGNGVFEQGIDKTYAFGGQAGDVPVVGDWTGTGTSKIGLVRQGFFWILDANGNGTFDGTGAGQDFAFAFGGIAGDVPVVGDWNGSGTSKVGMFRQGFFWVLDANGNHQFDGTGPGQDLAFAFGGISGDVPVVGKWSSAIITATSGTPQTTSINTAFAAPLTATLTDLSGSPLAGVPVTFTAPTSGASGTFAGGSTTATATTNGSGVATSPTFTANATGGFYTVMVSAPRVGIASTFSLINTNPSLPTISVGSLSVGQNLQMAVTVSLSQSAGAGGVPITVTSSDPHKLLIAGRPQDSGTGSVSFTINAGSSVATVYVQGVTSSGAATLTATTTGAYNPGYGTISLTPSGFVLSGPFGIGTPSFSIGQGANTTLTVTVGRYDSSFNFVEPQQLAPGVVASVAVTSGTTSVGTISTSPLTFSNGIGSLTTQFVAVAPGSTIVTAVVPSGFSTPAGGLNILTGNVTAASLVPANVTVGHNLETTANVGLNGVAPSGGLTVTISSNDSSLLLLAVNPTDVGSPSIMLTIPAGLNHTQDFYVYGLGGGGLVRTYTATAAGFGSANGTVTLARSGFILAGPGGIGSTSFVSSSASPPSTINVYSALLDSSSNFVAVQQLRGGISENINVISGNTTVGTISTSPVTIAAGGFTASTQFQPLSAGTSVVSVNVPTGFDTPAQDTSVTATINQPGLSVTDGIPIGTTLETLGSVVIGQQAPAGGQTVLLTSNNPSQLKLALQATGVGSNSITVTIPAGSNSASFYLQAFGGLSAPTYTATATGFRSGTGTIQVTASAAAIAGPFGSFPFSTTVGSPPTNLIVSMIQLSSNGSFQSTQQLAGGLSLMVSLSDSNSAVATVPASVTIPGGSAQTNAAFTPVATGQATISVPTPAGYTVAPSGYGSVTGTVN